MLKFFIPLSIVMILFGSCTNSKFLNRKYTSGRFVEYTKNIKHNTISTDQSKALASANPGAVVPLSVETKTESEKEIIDLKAESILKKDSVFIIRKRGRDKIIVHENNLVNDTVYLNENCQVIAKKTSVKPKTKISEEKLKKKMEHKIKTVSTLALAFSLIPLLGFIFSLTAGKIIRKYEERYPAEEKQWAKVKTYTALALSIIPSLAAVLIVLALIFLLFMLVFGGAALVVI